MAEEDFVFIQGTPIANYPPGNYSFDDTYYATATQSNQTFEFGENLIDLDGGEQVNLFVNDQGSNNGPHEVLFPDINVRTAILVTFDVQNESGWEFYRNDQGNGGVNNISSFWRADDGSYRFTYDPDNQTWWTL